MRKLFLLLLSLPMALLAQNRQAQKLDSIADVFMADHKYDEAITTLYRELNALESSHPDSLYIAALIKIGNCYDLKGVPMKAIESAKRAIDLYSVDHATEDLVHADLYDHIGQYYRTMRNYPEAYRWSQRAVTLYNQLPCPTPTRINGLVHAGFAAKESGRTDEAVTLQQQAAELACQHYGDHSDQYLDQLGTLKRHCMANGDQQRAQQLGDEHLRLTREIRDGILPADVDLSTPALCRRHNREILMCCRWLLKHYVTHPDMPQASNMVIRYCRRSPDATFYYGPVEKKWNKRAVSSYLVAYMAASVEFALTHSGEPHFSLPQYKYAVNKLIDYYIDNKGITGTVWAFESYLKLRNKGGQHLDLQLEKDFEEYKNYMTTRHQGDIEVDNLVMMGVEL